jgi:REP element-mobilizing transposase RayT
MMNNILPSRRSLRLKGYDYSKSGLYFITLCVQHRQHLFGKFVEKDLELNGAGKMVERWYFEMQNKYPNIRCHEMVVMPNHFHCIIEITVGNAPDNTVTDAHVGAPLRGRPNNAPVPNTNTNMESPNNPESNQNPYGPDNKKYNATIGDMMDWFKTMTTNEYIRGVKKFDWQRFNGKLWQRNYWEHIIRDEVGLTRIANYIVTNPENWQNDRFNSDEI